MKLSHCRSGASALFSLAGNISSRIRELKSKLYGENFCFNEALILPTDNRIIDVTGLDPNKLARLKVLELRGNKMVNTKGINLPNIARLYLVS